MFKMCSNVIELIFLFQNMKGIQVFKICKTEFCVYLDFYVFFV